MLNTFWLVTSTQHFLALVSVYKMQLLKNTNRAVKNVYRPSVKNVCIYQKLSHQIVINWF